MPNPLIAKMLGNKSAMGPGAPQSSAAPVGPSAPQGNARQDAHDKVVEGLTVLAHDYPNAQDLLDQFDKMYQSWMGSVQQSPMQGKPSDIPSSKTLDQGDAGAPPQDGGDQAPPQGDGDRGGPPGVKGKPPWRR